jgi:hypothetical protein
MTGTSMLPAALNHNSNQQPYLNQGASTAETDAFKFGEKELLLAALSPDASSRYGGGLS